MTPYGRGNWKYDRRSARRRWRNHRHDLWFKGFGTLCRGARRTLEKRRVRQELNEMDREALDPDTNVGGFGPPHKKVYDA